MISIVIIAVMAMAGANMLYMARRNLTLQQERRVATELARGRIERLLAGGYDALTNYPSTSTSTQLVGSHTFYVKMSIVINNTPPYKTIAVAVPYPPSGTATVTTVLSKLD
jgi:hypothetical protein